jgi:hypothetical protein
MPDRLGSATTQRFALGEPHEYEPRQRREQRQQDLQTDR